MLTLGSEIYTSTYTYAAKRCWARAFIGIGGLKKKDKKEIQWKIKAECCALAYYRYVQGTHYGGPSFPSQSGF